MYTKTLLNFHKIVISTLKLFADSGFFIISLHNIVFSTFPLKWDRTANQG